MPINGVHYIGLKLDDDCQGRKRTDTDTDIDTTPDKELEKLANQIKSGMFDFESIGEKGKEWALKNYSSVASSEHFIKTISTLNV